MRARIGTVLRLLALTGLSLAVCHGGIQLSATSGRLEDFVPIRSSVTVLTISLTGNARNGNSTYTYPAPITATLAAGFGTVTVYVYIDVAGVLTVGHNGDNTKITCVNCTKAAGVVAFPTTSIPLYTWHVTADNWDAAGVDWRAWISGSADAILGGPSLTTPGAVTVVGASAGVVGQSTCTAVSGTMTCPSGFQSGVVGSTDTGGLMVRKGTIANLPASLIPPSSNFLTLMYDTVQSIACLYDGSTCASVGLIGPTGLTGATGATGAVGATGATGNSVYCKGTGPLAHTGDTTDVSQATCTIAANTLVVGSRVRITMYATHTGTAGTFATYAQIAGVDTSQSAQFGNIFTFIAHQADVWIVTANGAQMALDLYGYDFGGANNAAYTPSLNVASSNVVDFRCKLANAGDTVTLQGWTVQIF